MSRSPRIGGIRAVLLIASLSGAGVAGAQPQGDPDFLFDRPRGAVGVRGGWLFEDRFAVDGNKHAIVDTRVHIDNRITREIPPAFPSYAEVAARQVRVVLEEVEIDGAGQRWNPRRSPLNPESRRSG